MAAAPPLHLTFYSSLAVILLSSVASHGFDIKEATIHDTHLAFQRNQLTSRDLVQFYLDQIHSLNPLLNAVIEVNPDALDQADRADEERRRMRGSSLGTLHGIPVLLKDNIATRDKLNTTAGSLALLGSVVPRDAGVVERLRKAGAVILGKASLSEWANFRSLSAPNGWSARGGQGKNPYVLSLDPCGSSSGSAIAVAANMAAVSLGTETDGSIICPSSANGVVGIKPTVGLTSRSGVIPISLRQDTVGPICRTVSDAVWVLEAIAGYDSGDYEATREASKFIPQGGYRQFLKVDGLQGKRLGILRRFFNFPENSAMAGAFEGHLNMLRQRGAVIIDNLEIANVSAILDPNVSGEELALVAEFKLHLNKYLSQLSSSPVRTLADIIAFNNRYNVKVVVGSINVEIKLGGKKIFWGMTNSTNGLMLSLNTVFQERIGEVGQLVFLVAQNTSGIGPAEERAINEMATLSKNGLEKLMMEERLDAVVSPESSAASVLAIGGYPGISVPAGYEGDGLPFGICFGGLRGSEPKLIEIAYAFEQATKIRKPPSFKPQGLLATKQPFH